MSTFAVYSAYLAVACVLMGMNASWRATAVAAAIHGLSRTGDQYFTPDPAITKRRLTQIIPHKCCNDEFAPGSAARWMSFLRLKPERVPLCRQRAGDSVISEERLGKKAVNWVANHKLIIKRR